MNILRYTLIVAILLVFSLCPPVEAARHIIVIYDVSSSMYKLNVTTGASTKMESEDIRRVNDYLTNILFTNTSQPLRDRDDTHIKECNAVYVGKPLYQSGDIITYAEYAERRYTKINRQQVRRDEFQRKLPDPMNLARSLYGQVSYLLRAEVEIYDELLNETDGETYWIFVTDGDVDRSAESDPNIGEVLQRHAAIEEKYNDPMIVGILVNTHVRIEVRRIQMISKAMFIANPAAPNESLKKIKLKKDDAGQFISEPLIIDTKIDDKTKYTLNSINVGIVDNFNKPLQIVNDDNEFGILNVPPVSLHGNILPYEFQISLPANPEIAATSNKLKLEVNYNYNGEENTYSMLTDYETVIDNIYVSDVDNPNQQVEEVMLRYSEGVYLANLVVRSENPDKSSFQIRNIHCHILNKNGQKLCDVSVKTIPQKLDEPFQVMVPNEKGLDLYGNKFVLDIDYHYNDTSKSETIKLPVDPDKSNQGILMAFLIILGVGVLAVVGFALFRLVRNMFSPSGKGYQIMLGEVYQEGMRPDDRHFFSLSDGETLSFGAVNTDGMELNVGSPAVLRCRHGEFLLFKNANDENGDPLTSGETLTLTRDEGDDVLIYFENMDDDMTLLPDPDPFNEEDDSLLD